MSKIYAHFERILDARKATDALKNKGYTAYLDAPEKNFEEYAEEINFAGSKNASSLSSLVLKSGGSINNIFKAPLVAADPMVSGMGSYTDIAENLKTRLIVNAEHGSEIEVYNVIKEFGGSVS